MAAHLPTLFTYLAGVAAAAALLCAINSRQVGMEVRFWLIVAVAAVTMIAAA